MAIPSDGDIVTPFLSQRRRRPSSLADENDQNGDQPPDTSAQHRAQCDQNADAGPGLGRDPDPGFSSSPKLRSGLEKSGQAPPAEDEKEGIKGSRLRNGSPQAHEHRPSAPYSDDEQDYGGDEAVNHGDGYLNQVEMVLATFLFTIKVIYHLVCVICAIAVLVVAYNLLDGLCSWLYEYTLPQMLWQGSRAVLLWLATRMDTTIPPENANLRQPSTQPAGSDIHVPQVRLPDFFQHDDNDAPVLVGMTSILAAAVFDMLEKYRQISHKTETPKLVNLKTITTSQHNRLDLTFYMAQYAADKLPDIYRQTAQIQRDSREFPTDKELVSPCWGSNGAWKFQSRRLERLGTTVMKLRAVIDHLKLTASAFIDRVESQDNDNNPLRPKSPNEEREREQEREQEEQEEQEDQGDQEVELHGDGRKKDELILVREKLSKTCQDISGYADRVMKQGRRPGLAKAFSARLGPGQSTIPETMMVWKEAGAHECTEALAWLDSIMALEVEVSEMNDFIKGEVDKLGKAMEIERNELGMWKWRMIWRALWTCRNRCVTVPAPDQKCLWSRWQLPDNQERLEEVRGFDLKLEKSAGRFLGALRRAMNPYG